MNADRFRFFVSGQIKPVLPNGRLWQTLLSGDAAAVPSCTLLQKDIPATIGQYFYAAAQFLSGNNFTPLRAGLSVLLNKRVREDQIKTICLHLEKHGAFYHPMKVETVLKDGVCVSLVLNGAVSEHGLMLIDKEYRIIQKFNKNLPYDFLPRVFSSGEIQTDKRIFRFFLGQWFDEFKEFHVSEDQGNQMIALWHSDGTIHTLPIGDAGPLYEKIAEILTVCYNIETFDQICAWHHAAGDFIVKYTPQKTDVRLITVREYAAVCEFGESKTDQTAYILPALLVFFLNLTIRIRLDRLNGTGRMIWLNRTILNAAVAGFLTGLKKKTPLYDYGDLSCSFITFFKQFDPERLTAMAQHMIEFDHPDRSEMELIRENLVRHCDALFSIFKSL